MSTLDLTKAYLRLKEQIKEEKKALHEAYMADTEYAGFYEEVKIAKEVLNNRRDQISIGALGTTAQKIKALQSDLKDLKNQILSNVTVTVTDKASGEQLSLPF